MNKAQESILAEREKQDDKWGEQNHNPYIYLAILVEEIGELAQSILHTQFGGDMGNDKGGLYHLRKEAIHTAAVAMAIVECLDRDKWTENDVSFPYRYAHRQRRLEERMIKCPCGDPECKISIRLNETGMLWFTDKHGIDTTMYLHPETIRSLIAELEEAQKEMEARNE